ncbi:hypothetical protein [Arthrobacter sp. ok362]|uniref:hypothetical protein n=1 Tax=Arthrobacter sp. ok362 TaxID=1761745 RepID=UPI00088F06CB|nr:hypothetical protein [Arthrobacter sp. ok362]SDL53613.1 hypothetical protein SAMN04487913_110173 [Arthrobacter sp. ok362]
MHAFYSVTPIQEMLGRRKATGVNSRKVMAAAGIAGALCFTSACSASVAASPAGTASPSGSASAAASPSATPTTVTFPYTLPNGIVAKGVANDGKGPYLQTSIADTDPAMKYNPAITDDAAKAHYSAEELAEAQKVIVRFIAEEAIDSTLNDGTDVDGWFAAHKNQIHTANQPPFLNDLKSPDKAALAREAWMAKQPGLSYAHGASTPRVTKRTITPKKFRYVTGYGLEGVMLDTNASYEMAITYGVNGKKVQSTTADISYAVAKDPADGNKWKIAGYYSNYTTAEFIIK